MGFVTDFLYFVIRQALQKEVVRQATEKGLLLYLKALQIARKSLIGMVLVFAVFQIMVIGFVGSIVSVIFLLPQEMDTKLWILIAVFGVLFLIPLGVLAFALSERTWYKASGAEKALQQSE